MKQLTHIGSNKISRLNDNSGQLFNHIIQRFQLKNDSALCAKLGVNAPVISKVRKGHNQVSAELILRIHETLRIQVADIRALMAMHPCPDEIED